MLARALPGVPVLVAAERHLAGILAERRLGATVHVLDDGFQHLQLHRDVDLLIVGQDDVEDGRTLPGGRLREPLDSAAYAHALLVPGVSEADARALAERLHVPAAFTMTRTSGLPRAVGLMDGEQAPRPEAPVLAVAGIANPRRFFQELSDDGWNLAGTLEFRDHHPYGPGDIARMVQKANACGAVAIVTTEKDVIRVLPFRPLPMPVLWVPLSVTIAPAPAFRDWLGARLADARNERGREEGRTA